MGGTSLHSEARPPCIGAERSRWALFLVVFVVVVVVVVVAVVVFAVVALFLVYLFVRVPFLVGLLWLRVPLLLCGVPLLPYSVSVHP